MVAETLESPGRPPGPGSQGAAFPKVAVSGTHSENRAAGTGTPNARLRALTVCALGFAASLKLLSTETRLDAWIPVSVASESGPLQVSLECQSECTLGTTGRGPVHPISKCPRLRMAEGLILFFYFTHIHFTLLPLYSCYTAYKKHQSLIHFPALAQS